MYTPLVSCLQFSLKTYALHRVQSLFLCARTLYSERSSPKSIVGLPCEQSGFRACETQRVELYNGNDSNDAPNFFPTLSASCASSQLQVALCAELTPPFGYNRDKRDAFVKFYFFPSISQYDISVVHIF